jgi:hypothetical protein
MFSLGDIARNPNIDLAASFRVGFTEVFDLNPGVSQTHTDITPIGVFGKTVHPKTDERTLLL